MSDRLPQGARQRSLLMMLHINQSLVNLFYGTDVHLLKAALKGDNRAGDAAEDCAAVSGLKQWSARDRSPGVASFTVAGSTLMST